MADINSALNYSSKRQISFNDGLVRSLIGASSGVASAGHAGSVSMSSMQNKIGPDPYGTYEMFNCSGYTLINYYSNGQYGEYTNVTNNSPTCGWNPPAAGTLAQNPYCSGSTLVRLYNDGNYGTYYANVSNSTSCGVANSIYGITCPGTGSQGISISADGAIVSPQDDAANHAAIAAGQGNPIYVKAGDGIAYNISVPSFTQATSNWNNSTYYPSNPNPPYAPICTHFYNTGATGGPTTYTMNKTIAFAHPNTTLTAADVNSWGFDASDVRRAQNIYIIGFGLVCNENVNLAYGLLTQGSTYSGISGITLIMSAIDNPIADENYHGYGIRSGGYGMSNINAGPFGSPMGTNQLMILMLNDDTSGYGCFSSMELDVGWTDYGGL